MELIDELIRVYYEEEDWIKNKLPREEIRKYYEYVLDKDKIIFCTNKQGLVGYLEYWRVTEEQLNRILLGKPFHIADENIDDGEFCYIQSIWINKQDRDGVILNEFKRELYKRIDGCLYLVGEEYKRDSRIKLFNKE